MAEDVFLRHALKPEELTDERREARQAELLRWFERYFRGDANPKWLHYHAAELAYLLRHPTPSRESVLEEALRPFAQLGEVVLSEAPPDALAAWSFVSADGLQHLISLDTFRAAIRALALTAQVYGGADFGGDDEDSIPTAQEEA